MAKKYVAYPEYKESGVEWLVEIPKHWEVVRLKYIAKLSGNKTSGSENKYVGLENVESKTGKFKVTEGIISEGVSNTFEKDNLLFGKLRPYLAKSWLASFSGICSSEFLVLDSKLVHPKFLKYMTLTDEFIEQVNSSTYGTKMPRASWDFISLLSLPVMDYNLSETIANFLDYETAQIDTLIEKQQTLIQLLKEKRQAVISHAVTKGLNPDAPMKESGVEWLGKVPEHWRVGSLGYYAALETGTTPSRANPKYWDGSIPWVKTGEVKYDTIYDAEEKITDLAVIQTSVRVSPVGTLLMAMYGQGVTRGRVALLGLPAAYNQACVAITVDERIWNEYLKWFFIAGYHAIRDGGNETSQMNLNADIVRKFKILVPPKSEQKEIINVLLNKLPLFDDLLEKANIQIQLMQERRTALISAAVTGKIDVRGWWASEAS